MYPRLYRVLRTFRPHILHTHNYVLRYASPAALLARFPRVVHTIHNVADREVDRAGLCLQRVAFRRGVAPVAIAEAVSASFRNVYGFAEAAAFAAVFDRHWQAIHRWCVSRAGPAGEDLAAETFRVAFDERARFDPRYDDARPWLYGIATNVLRHYFRAAARRGEPPVSRETDFTEDALGRVEARALGPSLAAALREVAEHRSRRAAAARLGRPDVWRDRPRHRHPGGHGPLPHPPRAHPAARPPGQESRMNELEWLADQRPTVPAADEETTAYARTALLAYAVKLRDRARASGGATTEPSNRASPDGGDVARPGRRAPAEERPQADAVARLDFSSPPPPCSRSRSSSSRAPCRRAMDRRADREADRGADGGRGGTAGQAREAHPAAARARPATRRSCCAITASRTARASPAPTCTSTTAGTSTA